MSIDKAFIREAQRLAKFPGDARPLILALANTLAGDKTTRRRRVQKAAPKKPKATSLGERARQRVAAQKQLPMTPGEE